MEILKPGSIKLDFLESIFRNKSKVTMDLSLKGKIEKRNGLFTMSYPPDLSLIHI